jgi:hypothetical protein
LLEEIKSFLAVHIRKYSKIIPILWKRLASGFAVAALFVAFARSLGFDWVPTLSFVALYALIVLARIRHLQSQPGCRTR